MAAVRMFAMAVLAVSGSGNVVEQSRNVGDFSSVHVASGIQVKIEPGRPGPIVLRGEDNILPLVKTDVEGVIEKAMHEVGALVVVQFDIVDPC